MNKFMETYSKSLAIKTINFDYLDFIYKINEYPFTYYINKEVMRLYE